MKKTSKEKTQTLADRLKLLRSEYRLSQAELANEVGVSLLTIGNIERGAAQNPHPDTLQAIADKFGSTYEWLLNGEGEMLPDGKLSRQADVVNDPWKDEAWTLAKDQLQKKDDQLDKLTNAFDRLTMLMSKMDFPFLHPVKETA